MGALQGLNQVNLGDHTATTSATLALAAPTIFATHDLHVYNASATLTLLIKLCNDATDAGQDDGEWFEVPAGTSKTIRNISSRAGTNVYVKSTADNAEFILHQMPASDSVAG